MTEDKSTISVTEQTEAIESPFTETVLPQFTDREDITTITPVTHASEPIKYETHVSDCDVSDGTLNVFESISLPVDVELFAAYECGGHPISILKRTGDKYEDTWEIHLYDATEVTGKPVYFCRTTHSLQHIADFLRETLSSNGDDTQFPAQTQLTEHIDWVDTRPETDTAEPIKSLTEITGNIEIPSDDSQEQIQSGVEAASDKYHKHKITDEEQRSMAQDLLDGLDRQILYQHVLSNGEVSVTVEHAIRTKEGKIAIKFSAFDYTYYALLPIPSKLSEWRVHKEILTDEHGTGLPGGVDGNPITLTDYIGQQFTITDYDEAKFTMDYEDAEATIEIDGHEASIDVYDIDGLTEAINGKTTLHFNSENVSPGRKPLDVDTIQTTFEKNILPTSEPFTAQKQPYVPLRCVSVSAMYFERDEKLECEVVLNEERTTADEIVVEYVMHNPEFSFTETYENVTDNTLPEDTEIVVEHFGGGEIEFITGSTAYLIPRSSKPKRQAEYTTETLDVIGTVGDSNGYKNNFFVATKQQYDEWEKKAVEPNRILEFVFEQTSVSYTNWSWLDDTPTERTALMILAFVFGVFPTVMLLSMLVTSNILILGCIFVAGINVSGLLLEYLLWGEFRSLARLENKY